MKGLRGCSESRAKRRTRLWQLLWVASGCIAPTGERQHPSQERTLEPLLTTFRHRRCEPGLPRWPPRRRLRVANSWLICTRDSQLGHRPSEPRKPAHDAVFFVAARRRSAFWRRISSQSDSTVRNYPLQMPSPPQSYVGRSPICAIDQAPSTRPMVNTHEKLRRRIGFRSDINFYSKVIQEARTLTIP